MSSVPALPVEPPALLDDATVLTPADVFGPIPADEPHVLNRRERGAVLARIEALMEYWGITLDDLNAEVAAPASAEPPAPLPVKYRHPVSGETWDGQGPHPDWLRHALLKEGLRVDELKPAPDTQP